MKSLIHDGLTFTSKLTGRRIKNILKTYRGFKKAQQTKSPVHGGFPFSISVEPTTSCNLRCPECPSGLRSFSRPTGMMQHATFKKVIDELHEYLVYLILYFQGEPYLNPEFLNAVKYAHSKKIYTATSTNGHYLTEELAIQTVNSGLDRIIISMDGADQQSYEKYRIGGRLEKVISGIENLVTVRKKLQRSNPFIILQFLLFQHNIHQIREVKKLAKKLGVDKIEFKTAQVYNFEKGSDLIPNKQKYSRYQLNGNSRYSIKSDLLNKCWKMWHSCVMTWDGDIVPCCFDKDAKYTMGNIHNQSFTDIWNGPKYQDFRSRLFENRKDIDICENCTEGLKV
ncbi:MAG: SPASM domain-containing protein [Cyclobacteriaceae bacterium]|nr:SPASM domain-containing protein [Cyclobacteriaceae bacterium]